MHVCMLNHLIHVHLFATSWTVAHQAPLSMGFSRQEHWSRLPSPPPRDLPNPGIELVSHVSCSGRWVLYRQCNHFKPRGLFSPSFITSTIQSADIIKGRSCRYRVPKRQHSLSTRLPFIEVLYLTCLHGEHQTSILKWQFFIFFLVT